MIGIIITKYEHVISIIIIIIITKYESSPPFFFPGESFLLFVLALVVCCSFAPKWMLSQSFLRLLWDYLNWKYVFHLVSKIPYLWSDKNFHVTKMSIIDKLVMLIFKVIWFHCPENNFSPIFKYVYLWSHNTPRHLCYKKVYFRQMLPHIFFPWSISNRQNFKARLKIQK